jgi:hypothetical protein
VPRAWQAVFLENEYVQVMLLPELGGRIHRLLDKTNGYDALYHQAVIKPALVGLAGPWCSGGIEFNWPQHHRPSTTWPTTVAVERERSGAITVWMSEHDPMSRMKGMHGVRHRGARCWSCGCGPTRPTCRRSCGGRMSPRVHEGYGRSPRTPWRPTTRGGR